MRTNISLVPSTRPKTTPADLIYEAGQVFRQECPSSGYHNSLWMVCSIGAARFVLVCIGDHGGERVGQNWGNPYTKGEDDVPPITAKSDNDFVWVSSVSISVD